MFQGGTPGAATVRVRGVQTAFRLQVQSGQPHVAAPGNAGPTLQMPALQESLCQAIPVGCPRSQPPRGQTFRLQRVRDAVRQQVKSETARRRAPGGQGL